MTRRSSLPWILLSLGLLGCWYYYVSTSPPPAKPPTTPAAPKKPAAPKGNPPSRCPKCGQLVGAVAPVPPRPPVCGGSRSPDGTASIICDLSTFERPKNISSMGQGCCGYRSLDYAARIQGVTDLVGLPERIRSDHIPGGSSPDTVIRVLHRYAPEQPYLIDTSGDTEVLARLVLSQRVPCVTYRGHDPHYSTDIDHLVCLVCYDLAKGWAAILDNNYPAPDQLVWMGLDEFRSRWSGRCNHWVWALLAARPGHDAIRNKKAAAESAAFKFDASPDHPEDWICRQEGRDVGYYFRSSRKYYPLIRAGEWGDEADPPAAPPDRPHWPGVREKDGSLNFGLIIGQTRVEYTRILSGREATQEELLAAIGGEMVPVDRRKRDGAGPLREALDWIREIPTVVAMAAAALVAWLIYQRRREP